MGNFELAEKVINGEILPEYISEDGKLVTEANQDTASLPSNHPIMTKFKNSLNQLTDPESNILSQYNEFANNLLSEYSKAEKIKKELNDIKKNLESYINFNKPQIFPSLKPKIEQPPELEFPIKKKKQNLLLGLNDAK